MKKLFNKVFLIPTIISVIFIILMLVVVGSSNVIYNSIMSNSVTSAYYYCEDLSYTLKGDKCVKNEYSDQLLVGDANLDGNFDIKDVTYIQLYINNRINFDASALLVSDVNKDGSVNDADLELIQKTITNSSNVTNGSPSSIGNSSKYAIGKDKICPEGYLKNSDRCYKRSVVNAIKVDFMVGDINSDKKVDEIDADLLNKYLNGNYILNDTQKKSADLNQDNIIDINDLNQINAIIIENDKNSVSAIISTLNNTNLNALYVNTKVEFGAKFNVSGTKKYYYKWLDVKNDNNVLESKCTMIPNSRYSKYTITATDINEYVLLKIYNDSNCSNQINSYKTSQIKIKEEVSSVTLNYKLLSPTLTTNIVKKGTELKFYAKFDVVGSKSYYYKWNIYNNNKVINNVSCTKVTTNEMRPSLKVTAKDVYGKWQVYSDTACTNLISSYETEKYSYVESIKLSTSNQNMYVGEEKNINASVSSSNNNGILLKWNSSNPDVATVDSKGKIKAKKQGQTTITASFGDIKGSIVITVLKDDISIKIKNDEKGLFLKKDTLVHVSHIFSKKSTRDLYYREEFYSNNKLISSLSCRLIKDGNEVSDIIALKYPNLYIKYIVYSDSSCTNKINSFDSEKYNYIESIKLSTSNQNMYVGEEKNINASVSSSNNNGILLKWNSSNPDVATVDSKGKIKAKKQGQTTITASFGDIKGSIVITVLKDDISIKIKNDEKGLFLKKDTLVHVSHIFSKKSTRDLYYREEFYSNNKLISSLSCRLIKDGNEVSDIIALKYPNLYIKYIVYSDSSCTNKISSFDSEKYNYVSNIKIMSDNRPLYLGTKKVLDVKIDGSIDSKNFKVKWTSLNSNIATVDENGTVTGIAAGSAKIVASIGNISSAIEITVKSVDSIECPMLEYEKNGDSTSMKVNMNSTFYKYDIYFSTNDQVGSWADFELFTKNVVQSGVFSNKYKNKYSNQAKIVVYNKDGMSRNCYTPPLTWKWNSLRTTAVCPTFKYKYDRISGANIYNYQMDGVKTKSGIDKVYVAFNLNNNYQYSWYTSQKDGSYKLFKTYSTLSKDVEPSVTGQYYNRNGQVVVTDNLGNSIKCKTETINDQNFEKNSVGTTEIYSEKGFNEADKKSVINVLNNLQKESPAYLAASTLFLYKTETYLSMYGNSCGNYRVISNNIIYSESKYRKDGTSCGGTANSTYYKGGIKHEFGHSMDHMKELISGVSLSDSMYNGRLLKKYSDAYNLNKKQCNGNYCLRYDAGYSYGNAHYEFLADLISYDYFGYRINGELSNLRQQIMKQYFNTYQNNKTKFNQIKESFR